VQPERARVAGRTNRIAADSVGTIIIEATGGALISLFAVLKAATPASGIEKAAGIA
jgi:hypothetical protein